MAETNVWPGSSWNTTATPMWNFHCQATSSQVIKQCHSRVVLSVPHRFWNLKLNANFVVYESVRSRITCLWTRYRDMGVTWVCSKFTCGIHDTPRVLVLYYYRDQYSETSVYSIWINIESSILYYFITLKISYTYKQLCGWFCVNGFILNTSKSNLMLFSGRNSLTRPSVTYTVPLRMTWKFFGFTLDSN